ncbi:MAG: hypothetical protein ACJ790_22925 [Myxococcaceae bacterium]
MRAELTRPIPITRRVVVPKVSPRWPKVDFFWVGALAIVAVWVIIATLVLLQFGALPVSR